MSQTVRSTSPGQTRALGAELGALLRAGDVVLLTGELGSGKTCFAQGLAVGLGVDVPVKSSSFILLAEYRGRLPLYHADLYRLTSEEEVAELSLGEYASDGVLVVEWPERALREFPAEHLKVSFTNDGGDQRSITLEGLEDRGAVLASDREGITSSS